MGSLFNLILVLIFVYLLYQIFFKPRIKKNNPTSENDNVHESSKPEDEKSIQKKIDLSDVEDADYKEIK
jgi:hypothetical protein